MCNTQIQLQAATKNLQNVLEEIQKQISDLKIRSGLADEPDIPIPKTTDEEVDAAGQELFKVGQLLTKMANGERIEKVKKEKKEICETFIELSPHFTKVLSFDEAKQIMDMAPGLISKKIREQKLLRRRRIPGKKDEEYEYDSESDLVRMRCKNDSNSKSEKFVFFSASRKAYIRQAIGDSTARYEPPAGKKVTKKIKFPKKSSV